MQNPFDMSKMFRMFDPNDVQKFFDPNKMFESVAPAKTNAFDMSGVFDMNRKNFEAMVDANKAAAAAYKDLLEKQMELLPEHLFGSYSTEGFTVPISQGIKGLYHSATLPTIPSTVAISTKISAKFLRHPLEQHPAQHPEAFLESSNIWFTRSTTTMPLIQSILHGFHAIFPPYCQHPAYSPSDDYNLSTSTGPCILMMQFSSLFFAIFAARQFDLRGGCWYIRPSLS